MSVLITGPVGSFLADHPLTIPGLEIHPFKRWRSDPRPIAHLRGHVTIHEGDIGDSFAVDKAVAAAAPERIFHLAAQSYPSAFWEAPVHTMPANVEGTLNLLEAVRRHTPTARVHIAGTSAQYGSVRPDEVPITESHPMRPGSPYGVSKVAAELSGLQYHDTFGLHVVVTRSFNHVGPRQGDRSPATSRSFWAITPSCAPPPAGLQRSAWSRLWTSSWSIGEAKRNCKLQKAKGRTASLLPFAFCLLHSYEHTLPGRDSNWQS